MAVTFTSHGYDTTTGNPYTELAWADAHPRIGSGSYGVRSGNDWKVTAVAGQDRTVSIAAGFGWGSGVIDKTVANDTIQLDTIISGSRWDLIVARRDWTPTAGETKFMKINGGSVKAIPGGRLMTPGGIDDQPLALVQVTAGQTQPTAIVDLRCWATNGGMVAKDDLTKGFLNDLGTELYINGTVWRYIPGANDVPEWVSTDSTDTAVDITTFGTGWSALTGGHKPRVRRIGGMVYLSGGVSMATGGQSSNILTIPAAYRPVSGSTIFVGSGVNSAASPYQLALANGVLTIPDGYRESGWVAGLAVPVTSSWPIS